MTSTHSTLRQVVTFLILTFVLSAIYYYLIISAGSLSAGGGWYTVGLMWCPGLAGLITTAAYQRNLRGLGWGWGKTRYQVLSYFLPIGYAAVIYTVVWIVGLGGIDREFTTNIVSFIVVGTVLSSVAALGEEIGWRGFLVPRLARMTTFGKTSIISGLIWSVWHWPILLFADYNAGTAWWWALLNFTVMVTGISFAFSWIRLASRSVWTAMFLHASHNLYIQGFFDPVTTDTGNTEWVIGEFGAGLSLVSLVVAYVFWRLRHRLPTEGHPDRT